VHQVRRDRNMAEGWSTPDKLRALITVAYVERALIEHVQQFFLYKNPKSLLLELLVVRFGAFHDC
jgi:hypothetical protein